MKKNIITSLLFIGLLGLAMGSYARKVPVVESRSKQDGTQIRLRAAAEACLPGAVSTELKINNVRARINSGGDMWWDLADVAEYEVPYGSKKTSMFAGALWIGGTDINGQLKLAAHRYRQVGNDFFPGPLTIDGTAAVSAETCIKYDRMNVIYRKDVDEFLAWRANPSEYPDYSIPAYFLTYPAHGDIYQGQSLYLAPFFDSDMDGLYDATMGDYPYYDVANSLCHQPDPTLETEEGIVTGGLLADQVLKGDQTIWWVFNDKGNVHTETQGASIGLEIRAQAFAFSTNDEINNMTFYSFEIINRSTYTLQETYMSLWTDPDLGYSLDDYIGCDVARGLGYCYNGDQYDEDGQGAFGYGDQPPAIGIDFFQGPYIDPDGIDNGAFKQYTDTSGATVTENCNEAVNGVNFGNGIIDDERYGMRRFVYHNNSTAGAPEYMTDPDFAVEYYNLLRGIWKDNTKMMYGGNAHVSSGAYGPECDFMFPDETDPCDWGTGGVPPAGPKKWTEETAGNQPNDRRFMQSAGPFTLKPGALNYITVGLPWARATSGGPFASVELLRRTDDKCQRLFDNCFKVVDGPDAPDLTIQELDKEIILFLTNTATSNNYLEQYEEGDPSIVSSGTVHYDSLYRFEGYQIFQVNDISVSATDLYDSDKARLIAQCDVENGVSRLINFYFSDDLGAVVPREEVDGADEGIVHSFRVLEDQFATGDKRLVNNKKYYFMVIAYGFNEYEKYSQDPAYQIPGQASLYGQQKPYLAGRKNIDTYVGIPHIPAPESSGTMINANYGDGPKITRIEGQGNGGLILEMTEESRNAVLADNFILTPTYENGEGPVDIKVIDPLNVKEANYQLRFDTASTIADSMHLAKWVLDEYDMSGNFVASYPSDHSIQTKFEQIFVDLGISVTIVQGKAPGNQEHPTNGFLEADIVYEDPNRMWLGGIPDMDGPVVYNWIRSGTTDSEDNEYDDFIFQGSYLDAGQYYEKLLGGTWAPFRLVSYIPENPGIASVAPFLVTTNKMANLASVDIVFTPDKSKWTRCPVLETCEDPLLSEGGAEKHGMRKHASVDKNGNSGTPEATFDGIANGMGWFPGYAINIETGERLNVAFGEDSWLIGENGRDMLFNPTTSYEALNQTLFGGKHFLYVFGHISNNATDCPAYDGGQWLASKITEGTGTSMRYVFTSAMWCSIPLSVPDEEWLSNEARVRIRVSKPYAANYSTYGSTTAENKNFPLYGFTTSDIATKKNDLETAKTALDLINVVPNPYYATSGYEETQLDNRVKITNLPSVCTVSIYTIDGTLIRRYTRDDPSYTYIDWDLKNSANIPISGGVYLIHVNAPGIGERTIKWFGSLRPIDLNSF
ncbi:MAG: hypothetical protein A2W93_08040 [Bacteroidetes bacterium GWF2_43_63]|nr:MAG: hypothetical protein A2W94_04695 [Bacteroidetes bacterium GWE2_42_42]OFY55564.1 MAG: hypothetical protein A2W93_08040 [Bacteroidetes bacterium GWF2_43_63]HBG71576.1 T9SS C-terminal target domain-containing protein [Bacteroidales bacterium]HCB62109.1 T9SS C-terminal target domain-containing protein [Bacteroidales bacterium]HCY22337.1 T9SS C-terminal target domain-containing protein [Bacteroidales bacterium]